MESLAQYRILIVGGLLQILFVHWKTISEGFVLLVESSVATGRVSARFIADGLTVMGLTSWEFIADRVNGFAFPSTESVLRILIQIIAWYLLASGVAYLLKICVCLSKRCGRTFLKVMRAPRTSVLSILGRWLFAPFLTVYSSVVSEEGDLLFALPEQPSKPQSKARELISEVSEGDVVYRKEMATKVAPSRRIKNPPEFVCSITREDEENQYTHIGFASFVRLPKYGNVVMTAKHVFEAAIQQDDYCRLTRGGRTIKCTAQDMKLLAFSDTLDTVYFRASNKIGSVLGVSYKNATKFEKSSIATVLSPPAEDDEERMFRQATSRVALRGPFQIEYDASTAYGSSGSPIYNSSGVFGIHTGSNGDAKAPKNHGSLFFELARKETVWREQERAYEDWGRFDSQDDDGDFQPEYDEYLDWSERRYREVEGLDDTMETWTYRTRGRRMDVDDPLGHLEMPVGSTWADYMDDFERPGRRESANARSASKSSKPSITTRSLDCESTSLILEGPSPASTPETFTKTPLECFTKSAASEASDQIQGVRLSLQHLAEQREKLKRRVSMGGLHLTDPPKPSASPLSTKQAGLSTADSPQKTSSTEPLKGSSRSTPGRKRPGRKEKISKGKEVPPKSS